MRQKRQGRKETEGVSAQFGVIGKEMKRNRTRKRRHNHFFITH